MICRPLPSAFKNMAPPASSQQVSYSGERIAGSRLQSHLRCAPFMLMIFLVVQFPQRSPLGDLHHLLTLSSSSSPESESGSSGDLLEGIDPGRDGDRTFSRQTWSWLTTAFRVIPFRGTLCFYCQLNPS